MNNQRFVIEGGKVLNGTVTVSGSKNAALPIICAALLSKETVLLKNVPDIADTHAMVEILQAIGVEAKFVGSELEINAKALNLANLPEEKICSMRASILLAAPLLARLGEAKMPFPGGCVLGKRSVFSHTYAFEKLGCKLLPSEEILHLKVKKLAGNKIIMPETSVTATENAVMLAVLSPGKSEIRLAAAEPHVEDMCNFLNSLGAKISGIGTHFLTIEGVSELKGGEYSITGDYLEAGTFAIAALITGGNVKIQGIKTSQLDSFWQKLEEMNCEFVLSENSVEIFPSKNIKATKIRTAVYPSFPTDLQAPFSVLLTQAEGVSEVFETLFEGRLNYLFELEKMGAKIEVLNPHIARIAGKTGLSGVPIASIDIRAGAAMVLAALCANGTTEISNIKYVDRGYERLEEKLRNLGASIKRD